MLQLKCKIERVGKDSKTRCHKRLWHRVQWSHYRYQLGWWPLVGVQRNIVNVSVPHVRWITWDNRIQATGHSPSWATTTTVCCMYFASTRLFGLVLFCLKLLTLPLLHTMMELKQTDCFKLVHAAPLLFLTKEPKLRGGFFDHFGVFILVSSIDQWEVGVWGQAAGSQLGSFIPFLPPRTPPWYKEDKISAACCSNDPDNYTFYSNFTLPWNLITALLYLNIPRSLITRDVLFKAGYK